VTFNRTNFYMFDADPDDVNALFPRLDALAADARKAKAEHDEARPVKALIEYGEGGKPQPPTSCHVDHARRHHRRVGGARGRAEEEAGRPTHEGARTV
jgi:hypothetical protein